MRRSEHSDVNTVENWDHIHFSWRIKDMQPRVNTTVLLRALAGDKKRVLDIGCGRGLYFGFFGPEAECHGVELSPKAVADCMQTYPASKVIQLDLTKAPLPYPDNHFDFVHMGEMLEHVKNPREVVEEARRVLLPGEAALATVPFEDWVPHEEQLWYFSLQDMESMFSKFSHSVVYRWGYGKGTESFTVVGIK
jgi:SAM-dependent methyltransferase